MKGKSYEKYIVKDEVLEEVSPAPAPAKKKSYTDYIVESQTAQDEIDSYRDSLVPDYALLAAQGASQDFLDEGVGLAGKLVGHDYKQTRDAARAKVEDARKRTGIAGTVVETIGNVIPSMIPGGRMVSTAGKELALAALQGAGAADELEDVPKQAVLSTAISGATQWLGKGVEKMFFDKPDHILARTMGARNLDFVKARGSYKSPEKVAKRLDDMGFFRQGEVIFDDKAMKFVPDKSKSRLETFFKPQSLENLYERSKTAMSSIRKQKAPLLQNKKVPSEEVVQALDDSIGEFLQGFDVSQRASVGEAVKEKVFDDLISLGFVKKKPQPPHIGPGYANFSNMEVDAVGLDTYKGYLGDEVSKAFDKRLKEVGLSDEAIMKARSRLDELLDKIGGPKYKELNDISHDLNMAAEDALVKIGRESAEGVEKPNLTRGSLTDKMINLINPAPVGVGRARIGKEMDSAPIDAIRKFYKRAPVELLNNSDQNPDYGRKPQGEFNIPEQLIRTPLPRSTNEFMEKKDFVLMKVAQMAPERFELFQDVYNNDPEMIPELMPKLIQMAPHLFARDKYDRFDGRILTEQGRNRAMKDTLSRDDINSIEKAKILNKLNRDGVFE